MGRGVVVFAAPENDEDDAIPLKEVRAEEVEADRGMPIAEEEEEKTTPPR